MGVTFGRYNRPTLCCEEREKLKEAVARTARLYMEAGDARKDAQVSPEFEPARQHEREAHKAYKEARAALEKHGKEHGCLP